MDNSTYKPKGLAGWLILPGLGLIIYPVQNIISLYRDFLPIFRDGYWQVLTIPGSEDYHHLWGPYLLFEISGNIIFIIFNVFLIFWFLFKSYIFPKMIIIFYVSNLIFLIADFLLGNMIPAVAAEPTDSEVIMDLARVVYTNVIWVPYFLVSKRVKNTFIKTESKSGFEKD